VLFARESDPHWDQPDTWQEIVKAGRSQMKRVGTIDLPRGGSIRFERATADEIEALRSDDPPAAVRTGCRAVVDVTAMAPGFLVRYPRGGDVMRPFGMIGHKRLSDLFGDASVPRLRRGRLPVVLAGDEVIWVAGLRAAEAGRVGNGTEEAVALVFET
jgi:tRNA(Ile)-lysidine synthetase-like protein